MYYQKMAKVLKSDVNPKLGQNSY